MLATSAATTAWPLAKKRFMTIVPLSTDDQSIALPMYRGVGDTDGFLVLFVQLSCRLV
jgi:hypothetical protein